MAGSTREVDASREAMDNRTNLMTEEHLPTVVNRVLDNPMQSYDQFMDSFLYLSKDDVKPYTVPDSDEYPDYARIIREPCLDPPVEHSETSADTACTHSLKMENGRSRQEKEKKTEELEFEEIDEGAEYDTIPHHPWPQGKHVKVDNFLDEPGLSSSSDSEDSLGEDIDDLLGDDDGLGRNTGTVKLTKELRKYAEDTDISDSAPPGDQKVSMQPFPGEVDETAELPQAPITATVTRLSVGCPGVISSWSSISDVDAQHTDEVQSFTLDPDFDYDNVKLTPKWGNDDLQMFRNDPT